MLVSPIQYLAVFSVAGLTSYFLTPIFRKFALQKKWVDRPNLARKDQSTPVPYMGGIAVLIGFSILLIGGMLLQEFENSTLSMIYGMWIPALIVSTIGFVDDIRDLSANFRLVVQTIAALFGALALTFFGTASYLTGFFIFDSLLLVLWIVTLTNALNLLDNMDGLATGIAGTASLSYFAIALLNRQYFVSALALALAGSLFGFWFWNKNPARIYLGDSGALFIGFMLGVISIRINLIELPKFSALMVPLLVLTVPLLDTAVVIFTRFRRGHPIFEGGRDHLSHRLVRLGFSKQSAVKALVFGNILIGFVLLAASHLGGVFSFIVVLPLLFLISYMFYWFIQIPDTD